MIRLLHIVRRAEDRDLPARLLASADAQEAVLLLGDAASAAFPEHARVYIAARCARERRITPPRGELLEDDAIVRLLAEAERVASW